LDVLNDPVGKVINTGGYIYLARCKHEIVGTAALINEGEHGYELAKMSVTAAFQGKGISKLLIEKCINKARALGLQSIFLVSESQLKTAISLYEKYGFKHVPVVNTPYLTADVKMELSL
jgi:putative acetyltransferase